MTALDNVNAARLFQMLGVPDNGMMQQLNAIKQQTTALNTMIDRFTQSAGGLGGGNIANLAASGGLPGSMQVGQPQIGGAIPGFSGGGQATDFANLFGNMAGAGNLGARAQSVKLERFLRSAPFAKAHLERMLGGSINADGLDDGVMQVNRQPGAFSQLGLPQGAPQQGLPAGLPGALSALNNIGFGASQGGFNGQNPFMNMVAGGLNNTLANPMQAPQFAPIQQQGLGNWFTGPQPIGVPPNGGAIGGIPAGLGGALGGLGGGLGGGGANYGGAAGGIDPGMGGMAGLTVEDMVVAVLMKVSKKFDKDIKAQADKVNNLQQQQQGGGKGGQGGQGAASIDTESMKLKRMVDKRGQMFDMLRQIIDKYNETAKNMIQRIS